MFVSFEFNFQFQIISGIHTASHSGCYSHNFIVRYFSVDLLYLFELYLEQPAKPDTTERVYLLRLFVFVVFAVVVVVVIVDG